MTKDRRLGKGLAALLGTPIENERGGDIGLSTDPRPASSADEGPVVQRATKLQASDIDDGTTPAGKLVHLNVYEIDNNPFQPRRQFNPDEIAALAESLKSHEQLQPVIVRRDGQRFQLISGERRLRAAIHAGMTTVRAEIREADDRMVAELAIVENLQRKDLNAVEKAMSFRHYIEQHGCQQNELAKRLKIDRSTVANLMRLLELPTEVLDAIQKEALTAGHARALLPLGDEDLQCELAQTIINEHWSVRQTEAYVSDQLQAEEDLESGERGNATPRKKQVTSPQVSSLERQLRMDLGTKVEIKQSSKGKGKIVVHFTNPDEFERITAMMAGQVSAPEVAAA
ncbi:putative chromosome-partitioning protein ParB [Rosistilla carotiformis]|uniref:Putative chromosome-partitioning protein ParB n=1 Tax=Rosistilla carotiformis TaxID=2528017 RepID=A0A518JW62_9BACT|nr:ParB/RepB/Spo0J family partition protein [Rosistilla carotiformis]QDV69782.1 putative chromosome-partitioning protein ParB [Rosistilla carotiformis]